MYTANITETVMFRNLAKRTRECLVWFATQPRRRWFGNGTHIEAKVLGDAAAEALEDIDG